MTPCLSLTCRSSISPTDGAARFRNTNTHGSPPKESMPLAGLALLAGVTSHPDLNGAGATSFYGDLPGGGQGVFLLRDGRLQTIADTRGPFSSIGPLGPTMNEAGTVAFRADRTAGLSGIFAGDGVAVATVADTEGPWNQFHGLRVINRGGTVVFRADRRDGVQGIYAGRGGSIGTVTETGGMFETL